MIGGGDDAGGRFVTKEEAAAFSFADLVIQRMVWDGFSIMEQFTTGPNELPEDLLPVEGIFLSDDGQSLVEETSDERRTWPRLPLPGA